MKWDIILVNLDPWTGRTTLLDDIFFPFLF